jgi:metallo-beta-lactamase family protein
VVVKGKNLEVKASILKTDVFSGHADLRGLMKFVEFQKPAKLKKLFLVHGEKDVMEDFRKTLEWSGYTQAEIPEWGQHFELLENQ